MQVFCVQCGYYGGYHDPSCTEALDKAGAELFSKAVNDGFYRKDNIKAMLSSDVVELERMLSLEDKRNGR